MDTHTRKVRSVITALMLGNIVKLGDMEVHYDAETGEFWSPYRDLNIKLTWSLEEFVHKASNISNEVHIALSTDIANITLQNT